jgi:hypothetical protein
MLLLCSSGICSAEDHLLNASKVVLKSLEEPGSRGNYSRPEQ